MDINGFNSHRASSVSSGGDIEIEGSAQELPVWTGGETPRFEPEGACCAPMIHFGPFNSFSTKRLKALAKSTGLSLSEVEALYARFRKIAPRGTLNQDQFRSTLGMLGMIPDDYLPNRMFAVFDSNSDGSVTFDEYLRSFAILLRGTEEQKLRFSFKLADNSQTGKLSLEDFRHLVIACQSASRALVDGEQSRYSESNIVSLFQSISGGEEYISLHAYVRGVRCNGDFLEILGLRPSSVKKDTMTSELGIIREALEESNPGLLETFNHVIAELQQNTRTAIPSSDSRLSFTNPRNSPRHTSPSRIGPSTKGHKLLGPRRGIAVHFGHENWNMVLNMMIGIRLAVGRVSFEMDRPVQAIDFNVKDKFSIVPQMCNILDSKVSDKITITRFIDYAPMVFRKIREECSGISEEEYLRSVGPEQLLGNMVLGNLSSLAELSTEGKGGAFFYYTADGRFMIKTVTRDEKHLLKNILRDYYMHLKSNKDSSMLVRFFGLHGLRLKSEPVLFNSGQYRRDQKIFFVVMGNFFSTPLEVHRRFDLKGSWVGRNCPNPNQLAEDNTVALKDNEFVSRNEVIDIGPVQKRILMSQLRRDVSFFKDHGIIDYSLLLGIHDIKVGREPVDFTGVLSKNSLGKSVHAITSQDKSTIYYFGIIDILSVYNTKKKFEHFFKSIRYDSHGISAVPPDEYAERFIQFIDDHSR
jgi:1-phosphatidylinositol-4-phosphate 5-kinase